MNTLMMLPHRKKISDDKKMRSSRSRSYGMIQLLSTLLVIMGIFWFCPQRVLAEVVDRIVAIVNDDILTLVDLNQTLKPYEEKITALGYSKEQERQMLYRVREDLLNQMIEKRLTDQEVKRLKISVSDEEIDQIIERIKEGNLLTEEDLRNELAKKGLTLEEYRQQLKAQILRKKLVDRQIKSKIVITIEDINAYYEKHQERYQGETKYHLRNIILLHSMFTSEMEKKQILNKMNSIRQMFDDGEPFANLATKYSESPLAAEGGDLGFFKLEELSPQIQAAVKDLQAGEITPVLDTDQGYQVFYVEDITKAAGRSLEEVSKEIEERLYNEIVDERFNTWMKELRERSHIKIIK
jgi:peptidyl-prolyl cis-trans isomerase SurA